MEKRLKKTPTLTLGCATGCAKSALIVTLFIPVLSAGRFLSDEPDGAIPKQIVKIVEVPERQPPKELMRIYSIVRTVPIPILPNRRSGDIPKLFSRKARSAPSIRCWF